MKNVILILIISLLLFGCGKNKPLEPEVEHFDISEFPLHEGASWAYQVYDHIDESYDTVVVTITSRDPGTNNAVNVTFQFQFNDQTISIPMVVDEGTFGLRWPQMFSPVNLLFPLVDGKSWIGQGHADTFHVSTENVRVPKGYYISATKVEGSLSGFDDAVSIDAWLWHNIGILKIEINQFSMINSFHETWELISYNEYESEYFEIFDYPLDPGSYWYYQVHDKLDESYYDLKVEIINSGWMNDSLYGYFFEYLYPDHADTEFVYVDGNRINIGRASNIFYFAQHGLEFPLEVGNIWEVFLFNDRSEVLSKGYLETQAGSFHSSYQVEDWLWCGDECVHIENSWYSANTGLVYKTIKRSEYDYIGDSVIHYQDDTWDLKSFYINHPVPTELGN